MILAMNSLEIKKNDYLTKVRIYERIGGWKDAKDVYTIAELNDYITEVCRWNFADPEIFFEK